MLYTSFPRKQENTENAKKGKAKQAAEMLVNIWSRS